jgi:hypothetical protein
MNFGKKTSETSHKSKTNGRRKENKKKYIKKRGNVDKLF